MGMDKKAAELLGEPVVAGGICQSAGVGKAMMTAGMGGAVGGVAGSMIGAAIGSKMQGKSSEPTTPGGQTGLMYMAVTPTRVGFFSAKRGLLAPSVKELLVTHGRQEVAGLEIGGGIAPSVHVSFHDGTVYKLEVPRASKGKIDKVKRELGV